MSTLYSTHPMNKFAELKDKYHKARRLGLIDYVYELTKLEDRVGKELRRQIRAELDALRKDWYDDGR